MVSKYSAVLNVGQYYYKDSRKSRTRPLGEGRNSLSY